MAFVYPDRASEVTTSTGDQGDIILQGPEPSFWSFTSRMAVGDETTVCREDGLTSELVRVRLVAPDRLRYLAVYGSSNGGARVVWPAGQQRVYATQLGRYALLPPDAGQAGRPVVVQPDGTYGAGALTVPVPTGLTVGTLLDAASAGGRPDGAVLIRLVVTWDELPDLDYELEIRDGLTTGWPGTASNPALIPAGGGRCVVNVVGGYTYGVRLRARAVGGVSGWTPEKTIAATGDDVPPGPPTDMAVTEVYGGAVFTFTPPADADTLEVRFYAAPAADKTAAMLVGAGLRRVTLTGLTAGDTRWVWAASVDTSGNEGEWIALGPVTALRIEPGDLAAELGERIERLSDVDPASLGLAEEAALEAVLAAHEVRLGAQRRLAQAMTGVDATIDGVRDRLAGVETGLQQEVTTLTDETAALTRSLTTLGAVVEDNTAAIQAEQTARADADEALAESVTLVAVQAGNALAAVQTEATTRANADSALGQRIDAVVADTADNAAAILAEQTARTNADGALANTLTSVSAQATRTRTFRQAAAPAAPQAGDLWYDTASNNAPKRWSGTGWESTEDPRIAATAAAVVAEQTARADGDSALASSISIVSAQASRSRTFRQSAAPAAPQAGDVWYDTANGNAAKRYNGTAWELVDDARLAANAAAVTSEATARADADASLASQITTVSAQATRTRTFRQATAPAAPQAGDLWYDTASNNAPKRWSGTGWESTEDPRIAATAAAVVAEQTARADGDSALASSISIVSAQASRSRTFRQSAAPAAPQAGDVWYDTANGNAAKRYNGAAWELVDDARLAANAAAVTSEATARADADASLASQITTVSAQATRTRTFRQATAPGGPQTGDIWYDTSSNNAPKRYTGTVWENVEDPRTASNTAAIQAEQTARADGDAALTTQVNTAISKADRVRTFRQASAPASPQTGDVWYDTANNSVPKRWSGTAWESAEDPRIGQNVAAIQTEATTRANEDEALSQHITKLFARFSGGTNLVQRLNRWTSAFPVTEDATFASRYRVRVSGNAQSTVSPVLTELKPDTDYVLSFKARLAAGASSELHADLNPDTLPETAFAVTSSEWTTFSTVWKSPLAAIKNCRLRFFQYNLAGAQVDVTDVQLEEGNTPSAWSLAPGEMVAMVQQEADARASALGSMSTRIDTVQTLADGNYAAIQEQALSIDGLSAQYTVKVDVNGYVSGFGLATTAKDGVPTSTFTVLAEKFEITAPGGSKISPFVVQNGTVYLRSVVIGTGWIGDTHIGPNGIDAKHLKASSVLTDSIRIGSASGSTLSTVVSQAATGAQDPASRINAGSTTLDPGKIVVKGTRTLTAVGGWFYENTTEINGGALRAGTVTAREVATGTLTVNQFAAFSTGNDLTNSGFEDGWACWDRAGYASGGAVRSFGVNQPNADWHIAGGVTLSIHQPNATTGGYWEGYYRHPASGWSYLPVHPGAPYEFSLYTGAQRCHVQVYLRWLDVNGVEVGVNAPEDAASWNRAEALGGRVLSAYKRLWVKGAAPNNAAFAEPVIRKHDTVAGQADSWAFFALPLFGPCAPYATGPQPWQPGGVTKITGGQLAADDIIIRHNAQLGNATVKTLSIGANQVTVPITSGVMHPGYLPDHDVVLAECYTIEGVGQPIRVTASGMHTLDAYSSQDWGQSTAVFRIQRGTWSPTTGWSWVDLVADLGGSMSMRDISVATGVSKPWSFGVTDREPPAVSLAYRLVGRRIVPWNIVSLAYWSIEATEYRR